MNRHIRKRNRRGISTIALMLILAFFVILPLGLLGFEITRSFLIQQELQNITDSAALSGTAAMASAPETDSLGNPTTYTQRQVIAMQTALQTFQFNSILQTAFGTTNVTANQNPQPPSDQTPGPHKAILNIILLDQQNNQVATGVPAATLTVHSYYTDQPIFVSNLLPIPANFTVQAVSNGGLPELDVILCMDVSGSMDDQTKIQFINRYWDVNTQKMVYFTPTSSTGQLGQGIMYDVLKPAKTGTSLNVYPPQNLENASYQTTDGSANYNGFTWSETPDSAGPPAVNFSSLKGLRSNTTFPPGPTAMPEQGMPPGNFQTAAPTVNRTNPATRLPYAPKSQDGAGGFTDMVALMTFPCNVSYNGQTYTFPNVETEVEAARGNMETAAILKTACCNTIPGAITVGNCKPGYFGAYLTWVLQNASPIAVARDAAYNFFNTMNISANAHFGLVCFSTTPGTSATSVFSDTTQNLSSQYPAGGQGVFPNPLIKLSKTALNSQQFSDVTQAIQGNPINTPIKYAVGVNPLRPEGSTDISESLDEAIAELDVNSSALVRPTAKRAIVLFTDGIPNKPTSAAAGKAAALVSAGNARDKGIPIYTIGLATNPNIVGDENDLLTDAPTGIAGISAHNAIYVNVGNAAQLDQAFQTIARSLCAIH